MLEVEVVAENTSCPVERDGSPASVVEDAQCVDAESKNVGALDEHRGECVDSCAILCNERGPVSECLREK